METAEGTNNKRWAKSFDKCPACGSTERFFETIVNELKAEGKVDKSWNFHLDAKGGPVASQQQLQAAPSGTVFPAYGFAEDFCLNCGTRYAIRLERGAVRTATPIIVPNRAERRRFEREHGLNPLGHNNPMLS